MAIIIFIKLFIKDLLKNGDNNKNIIQILKSNLYKTLKEI